MFIDLNFCQIGMLLFSQLTTEVPMVPSLPSIQEVWICQSTLIRFIHELCYPLLLLAYCLQIVLVFSFAEFEEREMKHSSLTKDDLSW